MPIPHPHKCRCPLGEIFMDNTEREWLQRELNDIKARISDQPCRDHGERMAAIEQAEKSSTAWKKIVISVWMVVLTGVLALVAYGQLMKK